MNQRVLLWFMSFFSTGRKKVKEEDRSLTEQWHCGAIGG